MKRENSSDLMERFHTLTVYDFCALKSQLRKVSSSLIDSTVSNSVNVPHP